MIGDLAEGAMEILEQCGLWCSRTSCENLQTQCDVRTALLTGRLRIQRQHRISILTVVSHKLALLVEDEAQFPAPTEDPKENTGRSMVGNGGWWLVGRSILLVAARVAD